MGFDASGREILRGYIAFSSTARDILINTQRYMRVAVLFFALYEINLSWINAQIYLSYAYVLLKLFFFNSSDIFLRYNLFLYIM